MSSSQIHFSSNPMYHDGEHNYIIARRGNTTWIKNKKDARPLQLEMALPMVLPCYSKQVIAAEMSEKHLIKSVHSPDKETYYEIDLPLDELEYKL